jgi:hypothetical protein
MEDASYHRARAEFCLNLANQMSDRKAAEHLRAAAEDHLSKAEELERKEQRSAGPALGETARPRNSGGA